MSWRELHLVEWICDGPCGKSQIGDEGLPTGWTFRIDDTHLCKACSEVEGRRRDPAA